MSALRVALVVQGEGRGHMTQALALDRILREAGHEISCVLVGTSPYRSVPAYFTDGVSGPVVRFDAPTQLPGPDGAGMSARATARDAAARMGDFIRSGYLIHEHTASADVIVNLLDLVGGLSRVVLRSRVPAVGIAHNHLFSHPKMSGGPGRRPARALVELYTRLTSAGTDARVALSFAPMCGAAELRLHVAPPLLRPGLDQLDITDEGYLLAYALNAGYGDVLAEWQRRHPEVRVHCFVDGGPRALSGPGGPDFIVHDLDQDAFVARLAACRAYVGSAGFESICEAFHLGKPVLAVPTEGQLEQELNAWDAERHGAARAGGYADLGDFWTDPPTPERDAVAAFHNWVAEGPARHVDIIERVARGAPIPGSTT